MGDFAIRIYSFIDSDKILIIRSYLLTNSCCLKYIHSQTRSYVQARGGSRLLVRRRLNLFETKKCNEKLCSTIGCANFGPDWPLLFKVHEIWSVDSQENH